MWVRKLQSFNFGLSDGDEREVRRSVPTARAPRCQTHKLLQYLEPALRHSMHFRIAEQALIPFPRRNKVCTVPRIQCVGIYLNLMHKRRLPSAVPEVGCDPPVRHAECSESAQVIKPNLWRLKAA